MSRKEEGTKQQVDKCLGGCEQKASYSFLNKLPFYAAVLLSVCVLLFDESKTHTDGAILLLLLTRWFSQDMSRT